MNEYDWLFAVLADLERYAFENKLHKLGQKIKNAKMTALLEVGQDQQIQTRRQ